jgi:putative mRNA 3-end processing factor
MALRLTSAPDLVEASPSGIFCPPGGFHIDPHRKSGVERAIITHAHSDHARPGMAEYLCSPTCAPLLRHRLGSKASITALPFGERLAIGDAIVSLHPAGHILGSAQVRIEHAATGETWVVTGDYKRTPSNHAPDPTAEAFETVPCHTLITESTFGLPIYRWPDPATVFAQINGWWRACQDEDQTAVLAAYSLGKSQRLLAGLDPSIGPILVHPAAAPICELYQDLGIELPPFEVLDPADAPVLRGRAIVIAPPNAMASGWLQPFEPASLAFASGWMLLRRHRRRHGSDRGFVLSDHVDWPNLMATVAETGCERVGVTHGNISIVVDALRSKGMDAFALPSAHHDAAHAPPVTPSADAAVDFEEGD